VERANGGPECPLLRIVNPQINQLYVRQSRATGLASVRQHNMRVTTLSSTVGNTDRQG